MFHDRFDVPLRFPSEGRKGLHLCGNEQPSIDDGIIKRFDPIPVPCSYEPSMFRIVQTDGKLSAKVREERETEMFVERDGDLGIALGCEFVTFELEILTDFFVVVELAVHDCVDVVVLVVQPLTAIWAQVDDGKTDVTERCKQRVRKPKF